MEFSRQEYYSGLLSPSPRDLLDPGIEPGCPALQADSSPSEPPGKPPSYTYINVLYTHSFFTFFSTVVYHKILNIVPVLYNRTSLLIHSLQIVCIC